jgi:hypothetical protein
MPTRREQVPDALFAAQSWTLADLQETMGIVDSRVDEKGRGEIAKGHWGKMVRRRV